jgi:hypothetical protein
MLAAAVVVKEMLVFFRVLVEQVVVGMAAAEILQEQRLKMDKLILEVVEVAVLVIVLVRMVEEVVLVLLSFLILDKYLKVLKTHSLINN